MSVAGTLRLDNGAKAYQREDREDRSFDFRQMLRTANIDITDVDGVILNRAKTEVKLMFEFTRSEWGHVEPTYLARIDKRRKRQNDPILAVIAKKLGVPAILLVHGYAPFRSYYWRPIPAQESYPALLPLQHASMPVTILGWHLVTKTAFEQFVATLY